jgi:hypothetical protein
MRPIWSTFLTLAFLFGFGLSSGTCIAQPAIDAATVLQICKAFLKPAHEQMPAIVSPEASKKFFEKYSLFPPLEEKLDGCLSASETKRDSDAATFLIQNTRYESYWVFDTDEKSIKGISIEQFRPVTLAEDEEWEGPFGPVVSNMFPENDFSDFSVVPAGPTTDPNIVEFFYATNRKELDYLPPLLNHQANSTTDDLTLNGWTAVSDYTGERNADLSFGAMRVHVPKGHNIGKIELPSDLKIFGFTILSREPDPTKHFIIRSIEKTDEDAWIKSLSSTTGKRRLSYLCMVSTLNFEMPPSA